MVFILPFVIFQKVFYPTVFSKFLFFETITLVSSLIYIINLSHGKASFVIPNKKLFYIFALYILSITLSTTFAFAPKMSFWGSFDQGTGLIFVWSIFVFSLITVNTFKTKEDWYKLFSIFSFSGILFTIFSLMGQFGIRFSKFIELNNFNGFLIGNSSWSGVYLAFVFFVSLGLAFSSTNKRQKMVGIIGSITAFFDPILTGFILQAPGASFGPIGLARAGSYSLWFCIFLFILYLIFRKIKSIKIRKIFLWTIFSAFVLSILFLFTLGQNKVKNFIEQKAGPNRLVYWSIAVDGFNEKPLLGWGLESYQYVYTKYFDPIIKTEGYAKEYWVDKSHNIFLDEMVTSGFLGTLFLILFYFIIGFLLLKKALSNFDREGFFYMALFLGLVSFLIQGLMIFQIIIGWFIIALFFSFVSFDNGINLPKKDLYYNPLFKNSIIAFACLIFIFFFSVIVVKPYNFSHKLASFPVMKYQDRIDFYQSIDDFYFGNLSDLGNAFLPYHLRLRSILERGLNNNEKQLLVKEIFELDNVLNSSLVKQDYMDFKSLTALISLNSIAIALSDGEEKDIYTKKSMFYIEKMKEVSPDNPIIQSSESLINFSYLKGEDSLPELAKIF